MRIKRHSKAFGIHREGESTSMLTAELIGRTENFCLTAVHSRTSTISISHATPHRSQNDDVEFFSSLFHFLLFFFPPS